jgi:outer membrane biosynthesis protein TonB
MPIPEDKLSLKKTALISLALHLVLLGSLHLPAPSLPKQGKKLQINQISLSNAASPASVAKITKTPTAPKANPVSKPAPSIKPSAEVAISTPPPSTPAPAIPKKGLTEQKPPPPSKKKITTATIKNKTPPPKEKKYSKNTQNPPISNKSPPKAATKASPAAEKKQEIAQLIAEAKTIASTHISTPTKEKNGNSTTGSTTGDSVANEMSSKERESAYYQLIQSQMMEQLEPPEEGIAKVRLTIGSQGEILEIQILECNSPANATYLETALRLLILPPLTYISPTQHFLKTPRFHLKLTPPSEDL